MTTQQVVETILEQLGGNRFKLMTGANRFIYDKDGQLSFMLPRNHSKINVVRVKLNGRDLYDMSFENVNTRTGKFTSIATRSDIAADSLQRVFTAETGLYTQLSMGR